MSGLASGWWLRPLIFAVLSVGLIGCASRPAPVDDSPERSVLIFGHVEMAQAPVPLERVAFRQLEPLPADPNQPYWYMPTDEGYFFGAGLPLGRYILAEVGGKNCLVGPLLCGELQKFAFKTEDPGFRLLRPGLYFYGSIRYKELAPGGVWKGPAQYELARDSSPGELEVLQRMLPHFQDSPWKPILQARISELTRRPPKPR